MKKIIFILLIVLILVGGYLAWSKTLTYKSENYGFSFKHSGAYASNGPDKVYEGDDKGLITHISRVKDGVAVIGVYKTSTEEIATEVELLGQGYVFDKKQIDGISVNSLIAPDLDLVYIYFEHKGNVIAFEIKTRQGYDFDDVKKNANLILDSITFF